MGNFLYIPSLSLFYKMRTNIWPIIVDAFWRKIPPTIFANKEKELILL